MSDAAWFAVRTFVANNEEKPWGPHDLQPGQIDYEERITLWRAPDIEAAIAMAELGPWRLVGGREQFAHLSAAPSGPKAWYLVGST